MAEQAKAKPLTRREVLDLAVTDADAFTALRYLRNRDSIPALPEMEEKGRQALPGIEGSLFDLYHALWHPMPGVKEEVAPARRYWRKLLSEAMATSAYEELHSQTQLTELPSILGTLAMGQSVLTMVPEKDQAQLQKLAQVQGEADELGQAAKQAQMFAQAAGELAETVGNQAQAGQGQGKGEPSGQADASDGEGETGDGQPQPGQGQPGKASGQSASGMGQMSPEQAQTLANQLAEQASQAQAEAGAAQSLADEAIGQAEKLAEELLGQPNSQQAQEKTRELARIGLQAVNDALAKVQEVSQTIESWGLDPAELHRQGVPEALGLLERMKKNQHLRKFAELLGRIRKIAARKAKSKAAGEGVRVTRQETGRDIRRAQRSEIVALTNPALRVKALSRWAHGELRLSGTVTKQKLGHGPVIVCEDASGSMDGTKQQWAKAVVLSLAHYAKLQRRSFGWIMFDASVRQSKSFQGGAISAQEMLTIAESRAGGGTDFERPLRKAIEMIRTAGLKKADITFITDGECAVSEQFLSELRAAKRELEFQIIAVVCDAGSASDATIRKFADRVEKASSFTAEEAEQKIFSHL